MFKTKLALPILALSLWSAQPVFAHHNIDHASAQHQLAKMSKQLNLSEEQKTKIKAIYANCHDNMKANREKLMIIHKEMHALVISPKVDEAKLDDLVRQKTAIMASMMKDKVMAKNQVYNLLNPVQQQKMQQMMHDKMKKMEKHHA